MGFMVEERVKIVVEIEQNLIWWSLYNIIDINPRYGPNIDGNRNIYAGRSYRVIDSLCNGSELIQF